MKAPLFVKNMELSSRLSACAALVRGRCVADIGTDHAYLPVYLIEKGICEHAYACDINAGPLASARENVLKYALEDKIELVLSDGLDGVPDGKCDCIVIAGMGGELICRIITESRFFKRSGVKFVLQPMSKPEEVRRMLWREGYTLTDDVTVRERGRMYQIMRAEYTGEISHFDMCDALCGKVRTDADYRALIENTLKKIRKKVRGMRLAGADCREEEALISEMERRL